MPHTIWLPAIISLISVFLGATITHWSNDRIQTKVMLDKLNIDKKAEALRIVLDTNRLITKHQICIISLLKGRITHEEFLIKEQNLQ